jgi:hypothetical protein
MSNSESETNMHVRGWLRLERFGQLLFESIDDTMRRVFGKSAELIYTLMERHVRVKREDFGENVEVFYSYLERLLGSEGAHVIQSASIKRLCLKLQREYEEVEKYFTVLDELYEIKFKLLTPSSKKERSICN